MSSGKGSSPSALLSLGLMIPRVQAGSPALFRAVSSLPGPSTLRAIVTIRNVSVHWTASPRGQNCSSHPQLKSTALRKENNDSENGKQQFENIITYREIAQRKFLEDVMEKNGIRKGG